MTMMTEEEYLDEYYFWKSSEGKIPKITILNGAKKEVTALERLSYSENAEYIDFFLYPAKKKLQFECQDKLELGEEIEFWLSYKGQSADGWRYHHHDESPFKHKLRVKGCLINIFQ